MQMALKAKEYNVFDELCHRPTVIRVSMRPDRLDQAKQSLARPGLASPGQGKLSPTCTSLA